jgi:hypothetical protein
LKRRVGRDRIGAEKRGAADHRGGIRGDYDDFDDVEKLTEFMKAGKR